MTRGTVARSEPKIEVIVNGKREKITLTELSRRLATDASKPITELLLLDTIKDEVIGKSARILATNTSLKKLSISLTKIGAGAASFVEALTRNTSLETLHFWNMDLKDPETQANFAANLITNSSLKNLILYMNLKDGGADIIAEALRRKERTSLKTLKLECHGIGTERFNSLQKELAERTHPIIVPSRISYKELVEAATKKSEMERAEMEAAKKASTPRPTVAAPRSDGAAAGGGKARRDSWWNPFG